MKLRKNNEEEIGKKGWKGKEKEFKIKRKKTEEKESMKE